SCHAHSGHDFCPTDRPSARPSQRRPTPEECAPMTMPHTNVADNPGPPADQLGLNPVNGVSSVVPSRVPRSPRWSLRARLLAAVGGVLIVAGIGTAYALLHGPTRGRADLVTHRVHKERLELTIVERGALESAKNADIYCQVKAGTKNSTVATTIKWVIDD